MTATVTPETAPAAAPPTVRRATFLVLVGLASASPFAMNAMLPSLPAITTYFRTSYGVAQLSLTLALVAFAIAQVVIGPLSDRFGRRPVMLGSFVLFVAGSVIAALAPSIEMMIGGRIVQAAGGAAGLVLGRTIARDVYGGERAASAIGYITMGMALAQMLAPFVGGVVAEVFAWQAVFWLMVVFGLALLLATWSLLPETLTAAQIERPEMPQSPVGVVPALRAAGTLLRNRNVLLATGNLSFAAGVFFAFVGTAPHIVQELWGRSAAEYGLWGIVPAIGYALGNYISGRLSQQLGIIRMIGLGLIVGAPGIVLLWLLAGWAHPAALFLPMLPLAISNGLTIPSAMVKAMNAAPGQIGSAAGVSGALQMLVAALLGTLSATFAVTSAAPMLMVMTVSFLLAIVTLLLMRRG